ncbi:MAG: TRAP transporter small permease [Burkholderiaceae bacterium]
MAPVVAHDEADPPVKVPLRIEDWLTVVIMGLLVAITFANVLVRYLTDQSFAWTEEISVFLMIVLTMVAGSAAVARHRHIRIEYFADGGSPARQRRLARFSALVVALFFALLAGLSVWLVWDNIRYEETSPGIGVPEWWYSIWLPVCSAAIALRALGVFIRRGRESA